jgi:hypothetical protein
MVDWASYANLQHAVTIGIRDSDSALSNLRAFIDFDSPDPFVLSQYPTWQQVAVTDGRRLILWHGSHDECAGHDHRAPHPIFKSSVSTVRLSRITDQALHTQYDVQPDGTHVLESVVLTLYTGTVQNSTRTTPEESQHYVETFTFRKSLDDGPAQMHRLLGFAAALSRMPVE